jgi:hypothetical protein
MLQKMRVAAAAGKNTDLGSIKYPNGNSCLVILPLD